MNKKEQEELNRVRDEKFFIMTKTMENKAKTKAKPKSKAKPKAKSKPKAKPKAKKEEKKNQEEEEEEEEEEKKKKEEEEKTKKEEEEKKEKETKTYWKRKNRAPWSILPLSKWGLSHLHVDSSVLDQVVKKVANDRGQHIPTQYLLDVKSVWGNMVDVALINNMVSHCFDVFLCVV